MEMGLGRNLFRLVLGWIVPVFEGGGRAHLIEFGLDSPHVSKEEMAMSTGSDISFNQFVVLASLETLLEEA